MHNPRTPTRFPDPPPETPDLKSSSIWFIIKEYEVYDGLSLFYILHRTMEKSQNRFRESWNQNEIQVKQKKRESRTSGVGVGEGEGLGVIHRFESKMAPLKLTWAFCFSRSVEFFFSSFLFWLCSCKAFSVFSLWRKETDAALRLRQTPRSGIAL